MSQYDDRSSTSSNKPEAAEGTAEPHTIYRDTGREAGGSTQTEAVGAVDTALAQRGGGERHESGATFHNDATAHQASSALGAKAFTAGSDVYFGAGQYQPGTATGDTLIRHELTHVQQSAGVAPPTAGNFRVSSPGDAAEGAARENAAGATASPSTIYRDPLPGAPAPAAGVTPPTPPPPATAPGGASAGSPAADPYEEFKRAINDSNAGLAKTKWSLVTDKKKLGAENQDFQWNVLHVLSYESAPMIREGGIDITNFVYRVFHDPQFDQWLGALRANNLLTTFLNAQPKKGIVTAEIAQQLGRWVNLAGSDAEAENIFEKVYPQLNRTGLSGEVAAPWTKGPISRLYNILAAQLPVGHVQTVTGGFTLMRQHTSKGKLITTNYAWWNPDIFRVVLNESSSGANGGGPDHDMTGGTAAGVGGAYTAPDGTAGTRTSATHFAGSALHEVGHGVGARMGGNEYAENEGNYPGWTNVGRGGWISGMWTGGAGPNGAQPTGLHGDASLSAGDAKDFFATEIADGAGKYNAGWFNDAPRTDIAAYANWKFGNEPLGKYWNAVVNGGLGADNAYSVADPSRVRGSWTYGYLTRFHGHPWAKLKSEAYNKKVSWYGVSSPKEWWAEQYAHYYRTEKTGGGLIDDATKKLLDELDKKQFLPTNASGTSGISFGGGASAGAGSGDAENPVALAAAGESLRREPAMFPW
jgi:Domain of unknown function (DUF4157)